MELIIVSASAVVCSLAWFLYGLRIKNKECCYCKNDYSEALASMRHYSTLRFAMLTVFSAASAAIASAYFDTASGLCHNEHLHYLAMCGTLIFFFLEIVMLPSLVQ